MVPFIRLIAMEPSASIIVSLSVNTSNGRLLTPR